MEIHLIKLMPLVKREGLMPPTVAGNKFETLRALYEHVVGVVDGDDDYKLELFGPDIMAHVPNETWVRRVAIEHPEWHDLSLYDRGAILAVKRIEGWERIINHHLDMQRSRKKKSGFKTMDETMGKAVRDAIEASERVKQAEAKRKKRESEQPAKKSITRVTSVSELDNMF